MIAPWYPCKLTSDAIESTSKVMKEQLTFDVKIAREVMAISEIIN
jgi:hypothetical protein